MSAAAEATVPPTDPDPPRDGADTPTAIGRVLSVVRRLIDYGKQIAGSLQQRSAAPDFTRFAKPFGTVDLAVILARITNGLRRAAALEARLCRRAERGRDLAVIRPPTACGPRAARQAVPVGARREPRPPSQIEDPRLARLLSEEEIAAEVRHRPIGAVIADICNDLGIAPGHLGRAFWDEIRQAITLYGGSLSDFGRTLSIRWLAFHYLGRIKPALPAASPLPATATGPP